MILHPGVIALVLGSAITLLMLFYAAITAIVILRSWDYQSSSAYQLALERKTYLVSTLVSYALGFQIVAFILFIYTVDDIHSLFVGAMCATGSLNANPVGWYALLSKSVLFFLSGFWLALNYIDQRLEQSPLVRLKYLLLCGVVPCIIVDCMLQLAYFLGLEPEIITSCCGSLFGGGATTTSTLSSLPVYPAIVGFYSFCSLFLLVLLLNLIYNSSLLRMFLAFLSAGFLVSSLIAIISFVSIYIYELPTHHCPFDILQKEYNFIGYPLYLTLFSSVYFGMLPGLLQPLKGIFKLQNAPVGLERSWVKWSLCNAVLFLVLVTSVIVFSKLDYL